MMGYILLNPQRYIDPTTDALLSVVCIAVIILFLIFFLLQTTRVLRKMFYNRALKKFLELENSRNASIAESEGNNSSGEIHDEYRGIPRESNADLEELPRHPRTESNVSEVQVQDDSHQDDSRPNE